MPATASDEKTVGELSRLWNVSESTVRNYARRVCPDARRVGRVRLLNEAEVERLRYALASRGLLPSGPATPNTTV